MVLDGPLAPARDEGDLVHAGVQGLLDGVLNERLGQDGEHLLGHRLGGRQEPGAVAGDRKQAFSERHGVS